MNTSPLRLEAFGLTFWCIGSENLRTRPTPEKKDIKVIKLQPSTGEESKGSAETKANSSDEQHTIPNQEEDSSNVNDYDNQSVCVSNQLNSPFDLWFTYHLYLVQNSRKEEKCWISYKE